MNIGRGRGGTTCQTVNWLSDSTYKFIIFRQVYNLYTKSLTGTYLQSDVILQVCENYILSHIDLKTVFQVLDVTAELGFDAITNKAVKLICANLGSSFICDFNITRWFEELEISKEYNKKLPI